MKKVGEAYIYDVKRSLPWTGILAYSFLKYPGTIRSEFPFNTLAANGALAEDIVKDNLKGDYSQGKFSSWDFCVKNNVKLLFLGIHAYKSTTLMHYPEDIMEKDGWPVKDFFVSEKYIIKRIDGTTVEKEIYIRDDKLYQFFCMFSFMYWMKKNGFLYSITQDNCYIEFIENGSGMANACLDLARHNKIFYIFPKRFFKN